VFRARAQASDNVADATDGAVQDIADDIAEERDTPN
jgi:hypothetical protein